MSNDEAKRLVRDGLILRKQRREAEAQEARMEAYEKEMISFCNVQCAEAKKDRLANAQCAEALAIRETQRMEQRKLLAEQRRLDRERMIREMERDDAAMDALRNFGIFCMAVALVTVWTPLPWWAAVALAVGCAALVAAYIFRLYFPIK